MSALRVTNQIRNLRLSRQSFGRTSQAIASSATQASPGSPRAIIAAGYNEGMALDRITRKPQVMGGKPCARGTRVTVGTWVGLLASGHDHATILAAYTYLEAQDLRQALA